MSQRALINSNLMKEPERIKTDVKISTFEFRNV